MSSDAVDGGNFFEGLANDVMSGLTNYMSFGTTELS